MILNELKDLIEKDQWTAEELSKIDPIQLVDEIQKEYKKLIAPINYALYSAIPNGVSDIVSDLRSGDDNLLNVNPFYERVILQILYMESKGLDEVYGKAVIAMVAPGYAAFSFNKLLKDEEEYVFLTEEYDRYISKSLSIIGSQVNTLGNLDEESIMKLGELMESLKEIIPAGDK